MLNRDYIKLNNDVKNIGTYISYYLELTGE